MKKYLFFSLVVLLITSCKDDNAVDDTYLFSGTYTAKRIELTPVRLFTSNGEVKDIAVIKKFVLNNAVDVWGYNFSEHFVFNLDSVIPPNNLFHVAFSPNNHAEVSEVSVTGNAVEIQVIAKVFDGVTYLESVQSSIMYPVFQGHYFPDYNSDFRFKLDNILKYSPLYVVDSTIVKKCIYLEGDSHSLRLPHIDFIAKGANTSCAFGADNNIKDDFIKKLIVNDTVAFQIRYDILEK